MAPLLPPCPTRNEFRHLVDLPAPWLPAIREIAKRHGLPAPTEADHRSGGFVVFVLGPAVVKLTPRWFESEAVAERVSLRAVHGRLPVPTPALLAEGEIEDWPYLLLERLPGEAPFTAGRTLSVAERSVVGASIGRTLRALHALPAGDFAGLRRLEVAFEQDRRRLAGVAQRRWGLSADIVEEFERHLAVLPPLVTRPAVPIHADLHHGNLLVEGQGADLDVRGVIDFGDAALGPPEFDLAVPALFLGRGDPAPLDALFDAYGLPGARRDAAFRRRLVAWMFLHPFGDMTRFLARSDGRPPRSSYADMERELLPPA